MNLKKASLLNPTYFSALLKLLPVPWPPKSPNTLPLDGITLLQSAQKALARTASAKAQRITKRLGAKRAGTSQGASGAARLLPSPSSSGRAQGAYYATRSTLLVAGAGLGAAELERERGRERERERREGPGERPRFLGFGVGILFLGFLN